MKTAQVENVNPVRTARPFFVMLHSRGYSSEKNMRSNKETFYILARIESSIFRSPETRRFDPSLDCFLRLRARRGDLSD